MYSKAIPNPLQLTPRRLRKHRQNNDVTSSNSSTILNLQNTDVLEQTDSRSTWVVLTDSPPSTVGFSPPCQGPVVASPAKSSTKIKRWLLRRKTVEASQDYVTSTADLTTPPMTAPAHLDPGFSLYHSRSAWNPNIEPPQLSLEELAKVDAFYAPTPILPETPAPRLGKVYPPWSPDIDYRFKPERTASMRFRSIKTADVERGISRAESLKLFCLEEVSSNRDQIPVSSRSKVNVVDCHERDLGMRPIHARTPSTGGESRRHQWVYRKDGDEAYSSIKLEVNDDDEEYTLATEVEHECDCYSYPRTPPGRGLFFIMGDSPIEDSGEVTLRFVKDPFERSPSPGVQIGVPSSRPLSLVDSF